VITYYPTYTGKITTSIMQPLPKSPSYAVTKWWLRHPRKVDKHHTTCGFIVVCGNCKWNMKIHHSHHFLTQLIFLMI